MHSLTELHSMKIINNFSSASSNFECIDRILLMSEFIDFIKFSPSNIVQFDVISVMYPFQLNRLTLKHSKFTDCKELKRKMRHHLYELNSYLVSGGRLRRWCRPPLMGSPEKILTFLHKSVCLFTLEPGQKSEAHNELP